MQRELEEVTQRLSSSTQEVGILRKQLEASTSQGQGLEQQLSRLTGEAAAREQQLSSEVSFLTAASGRPIQAWVNTGVHYSRGSIIKI